MKRIYLIPGLMAALIVVGATGFRLIEGGRWLDCFYMAVITSTTVGYGEIIPLSDSGRIFVMFYLMISFGLFTFSTFKMAEWLVSRELQDLLERRRVNKKLAGLGGHYIVCGLGRMGLAICEYLDERSKPFVVVDTDEGVLRQSCEERQWLFVAGDATDDGVLKQAGIDRAQALATVLPTDADNVYIVLTARLLAPGLQIVARAGSEKAVVKLEQAGATRVVSPFSTGAAKIARFMLSPNLDDFLEFADSRGGEMELVEVHITRGSSFSNRALKEMNLAQRGAIIVGIRRSSGERIMSPSGTTVVHEGDCLFAFGNTESVNMVVSEAAAGR
jgi:voltage-gated potassium channel